MFYVLQNESTAALRRVPILLTDAATGTTAQTGIALTNIYPYVNINGGAFAGGAGTVAEAGYGQYYYEFDASEVATLGLAGIHITASGCRDYDAIAQVAAFNVYSASGVGITAGDVWAYDISGVVGAGLAGSQLNTAATGGAGITAGDVWSYVIPGPYDPAETVLANINTNASNASSQTSSSTIRDAVWDTDVSYLYPSGQAGGALYAAAFGATDAGAQVWNYDISAISGAGLAGTQLNIAASGGAGITAGDVWDFDVIGFGGTSSAAVTLTQTLYTTGNIETYVANQTPQDVWTYSGIEGRTITGGIADTVTSVINTVDISTQSVTDIWSEDVSGYSTPSAGYDLTQAASGGAGITSGDVWSYASRTITGGSVTSVVNPVSVSTTSMAGVANTVWSTLTAPYTTHGTYGHNLLRSDNAATIGEVTLHQSGGSKRVDADVHAFVNNTASATAMLNILTGIGASMTTNITGNLSGSVGYIVDDVTLSAGTQSSIANSVWSTDISGYTSPSAGYDLSNASSGAGITAGDVWNYTLTSSGQSADTTLGNADDQATGAKANTNSPTLEANIWSYATRTLTSSSAPTAADIWSYATRTTTGGTVTNVTNPVTVSTTSMSGIANTVWTAGTKTITGGTISDVTNPVSVTSVSMSGIANTVWTYTPRTLTSGAGLTAGDVWTYQIDTITTSGTAAAQLNDAAVSGSVVTIVNGPYRVTSTAEGTDGVIDILADSIQPITIYCINGFAQPFNIAGYTASVDIYDEAGGFVRSYTPTIDYALGGILTFNIDADITGVIGRYTLVVSLTDGDVIQLGPLTILVRPL